MAKFPEQGAVALELAASTTLTEYVLNLNQYRAVSFPYALTVFCSAGGASVIEVVKRTNGNDIIVWRATPTYTGTAVRIEISAEIDFDDIFLVKASVTTPTNPLYISCSYLQYLEDSRS